MKVKEDIDELTKFSSSSGVLKLHNPFDVRHRFGCPTRLVVNTYKGCDGRCWYCYTYSYVKKLDLLQPKPKVNFEKRLDEDVQKFCSAGLPKYPVYLSSSCEPFQPLEDRYRHSFYTLCKLVENEFPIIVMTKNPKKLLENMYLKVIEQANIVIEVTVPFLDGRFEPFSPLPANRIRAIRELSKIGFKVVARLDPLIPNYGGVNGQSKEEIETIISMLADAEVCHIVSKCLRLVAGIAKLYPDFYHRLKGYYAHKRSDDPFELKAEAKTKQVDIVRRACQKQGIRLFTCLDHLPFADLSFCDGAEELLKLKSKVNR